ncbi:MAG: hypothetical protein ACFB9M_17025 [Myxococcota bacterium]
MTSPDSGRRFQLLREALSVAQYFDGHRSLRQVSEAMVRDGGPWVAESVVAELAADLGRLELLGPSACAPAPPMPQWEVERAPELPLEVHPEARFTCVGVGSCCRSGYLIPLDKLGADRIRRAARRHGLRDDVVILTRSTVGGRWTYALDNDPSCPFLGPDQRCGIHGRVAHPPACQVFPIAFVRLGTRVLATVTHRCGCGALANGRLLSNQKSALQRRSRLGPIPRVGVRLQVDDHGQGDVSILEAWIAATLSSGQDVRRMLQAAWTALGGGPAEGLSYPLSSVLRRLARAAELERDPVMSAAFSGRPHPRADELRADLLRAGLSRTDAVGEGEVYRFVRDHLFGLRPCHHGSLARGLFALTLAALDVLRQPNHVETRLRIMLWEDVFVAPSFRGLMGPHGPLKDDLARAESAGGRAMGLWMGA